MKGIILSGGLGTRLRPLTHTGAKQLIPIANKPILEYCIDQLTGCGITEIGIIVGHTKERIDSVKKVIGNGQRWGIRIMYIRQDSPLGISHAVYCAKRFIGNNDFVVFLGDNILRDDIAPVIAKFKENSLDAGMLLSEEKDPRPYGVAVLDGDRVIGIIEKPNVPPSNLVVTGIYYFSPGVFDVIERQNLSRRGEIEVSETLQTMITSSQYRTGAARIQGWWDDTGTSDAILRANRLILADIGEIVIGGGTEVNPDAVLKGPLVIGKNCIIGDTCLGPYTSVGDNCVIHGGDIESCILVGDTDIDVEPDERITDSLIGRHTRIYSKMKRISNAMKLIVGENTEIWI